VNKLYDTDKIWIGLCELEMQGKIHKNMDTAVILKALDVNGYLNGVELSTKTIRTMISKWKGGYLPKHIRDYIRRKYGVNPLDKERESKPETKVELKSSEVKTETKPTPKSEQPELKVEEKIVTYDIAKETTPEFEEGGEAPSPEVSEVSEKKITYRPVRAAKITILVDPRVLVLYNYVNSLGYSMTLDEFINASVIAYWRLKGVDVGILQQVEEGGES